jgi:hypothetical protein
MLFFVFFTFGAHLGLEAGSREYRRAGRILPSFSGAWRAQGRCLVLFRPHQRRYDFPSIPTIIR